MPSDRACPRAPALSRALPWLCAAWTALLAGCATTPLDPKAPGGGVELHLFSYPTAVTLGSSATPAAVALKIFATREGQEKGSAITEGTVEVLMYDGVLASGQPVPANPLKLWTLTPADLRRHASTKAFGVGYDLVLGWGDAKPAARKVTVIARYTLPSGRPSYSEPAVITLGAR